MNFLSGCISGCISAVLTHPFDVLKTKQQLSSQSAGGTRGNITLISLLRGGGIAALFSGLSMRLATVIPAGSIMITVYEALKYIK